MMTNTTKTEAAACYCGKVEPKDNCHKHVVATLTEVVHCACRSCLNGCRPGHCPARQDCQKPHTKDADCAGFIDPATDTCTDCGVYHGEPCACGGRGFHTAGCEEVTAV